MDLKYINEKKDTQKAFLDFIDNENDIEENYQNLLQLLNDQKIGGDPTELKVYFNLITKVANFHYRSSNFFDKIEKLLLYFKDQISRNFSNLEVFLIFQSNKRILLFLFNESILKFDDLVYKKIIINDDYLNFFYPEIVIYNNSAQYNSKCIGNKEITDYYQENRDEFKEKRRIGENDTYICQLIQKDDIDNFIIHIKESNLSLDSKIGYSIFETNSYLIKRQKSSFPTLIEYASFFGSMKIINYLFKNGVNLTSSLWDHAIHGCNFELIRLLEENKIQPGNEIQLKNYYPDFYYIQSDSNKSNEYVNLFRKSIKYFNIEVSNYIKQNYINENFDVSLKAIKYSNFNYFPQNLNNQNIFGNLCKFGYFKLVEIILNTSKIYLNEPFENELILFSAIEHFEIFKLLFEQGSFDINVRTSFKMDKRCISIRKSLLCAAIEKENMKLIQYLLSHNDINVNLSYVLTQGLLQIPGLRYAQDDENEEDNEEEENEEEESEEEDSSFTKDLLLNQILYEKTALHLAVEKRNNEIVSFLLNNPNINVNVKSITKLYKNKEGDQIGQYIQNLVKRRYIKSALTIAIENNDYDIVQNLLKNSKINVNIKSRFDYLYDFETRQLYGSEKVYNCHDTGYENKTALCTAIQKENMDIIQLLLSHPKININLQSTIIENQEIVNDFLNQVYSNLNPFDKPEDADNKSVKAIMSKKTPVEVAFDSENIEIFNLIFSQPKIDINHKNCGQRLFLSAIKNGKNELITILSSNPTFDIKQGLKGSLQNAVKEENIEMLKILLKIPEVDINNVFDGETALQIAARIGNIDIFNIIFNHPKIDLTKESCGDLALKDAASEGNLEIFKILLSHPDININNDSYGKTVLKEVIKKGNIEMVKILLSRPEINVNDSSDGQTALEIAAKNKNIEIVRLLLAHPGIDIDLKKIYKDEDYDKIKIIFMMICAKNKIVNPENANFWDHFEEVMQNECLFK